MSVLKRWRRKLVTEPLFGYVKSSLPRISDTERQALEAGDVWWDAELLSGRPAWNTLLEMPAYRLTDEEQAFIDGPVAELCTMIDDWQINFELRRVPVEIWEFLKIHKFFGMIIPREHGGLGFSAAAHSEVVSRISTCSTAVAVTVMVPNSLGPGELLLEYGTDEQRDYYLERLADGREIPAFGLTSPEAGSDAGAMTDTGVVCYGENASGERVLGMRLNWHKRYITLGPVATLLGLAFRLTDPDHILGDQEDLGITLALVPTETPGVQIGQRHLPSLQAFQNGPNWGRDVFLPLSAIIGGPERIGQGWLMLMSALSAGRSISLPALSAGVTRLAARTTGAYARIREQFGIPIAEFEGVQARLARIAGYAYQLEAARRVTTLAIDGGHTPSVVSAIVKSQATFRAREALTDAMDVHGGKTVCEGPSNYLANAYRAMPVAITVEGANILTRNLIIFGQGAIRCHPYLLEEIYAAEDPDPGAGLERFDELIYRHLRLALGNFGRALRDGLTGARFAPRPVGVRTPELYRKLSRYSAALGFVTEVVLIHLGGALKRRELISARLGDVLSELYLLSCVLKRFHSEGEPDADLPLVRWCCATGFQRIERSFERVFDNYPSRGLARLMRGVVLPFGRREKDAGDDLTRQCAALVSNPGEVRERLTSGVRGGTRNDGLARLERAFDLVAETHDLRQRLAEEGFEHPVLALERGVITEAELEKLNAAAAAVASAIAVDHFEAETLSPTPQQVATGNVHRLAVSGVN